MQHLQIGNGIQNRNDCDQPVGVVPATTVDVDFTVDFFPKFFKLSDIFKFELFEGYDII